MLDPTTDCRKCIVFGGMCSLETLKLNNNLIESITSGAFYALIKLNTL